MLSQDVVVTHRKSKNADYSPLPALITVALAFALRMYLIVNQSFAFDEGWTSFAIHHSWVDMLSVLVPDNHPPLYYLLVKALAEVAGYGDLPVRFLSVMCGTTLVAGLYPLGKRLFGAAGGTAAALFAACGPTFIYYAQEARMYSLLMALVALSSYAMLHVLILNGPRNGIRRWMIAYVLLATGALYTHYFAVLLIISQSLFALGWMAFNRQFRILKTWLTGLATIALLYLPWLPIAVRQVFIGQGTWWRLPLPAGVILHDVWRFLVLGPRRPMGVPIFDPLMGGASLAVLLAVSLGLRRGAAAWAWCWLSFALPVGAIVLLGSMLPVYTDRYALVAAPGLALTIGLGTAALWDALSGRWTWLGRTAGLALLAATLIGPLPQLNRYYHNPRYWREDFRRAAHYLMDKSAPGDTVVLVGCAPPIMQYYRGPAEVLAFPRRGDSVQGEEEVISLLRRHVNPGRRVRLVLYSWPTVDPQGLVEGQLRMHCELRGEHWQTETGQRPIRIVNFASCQTDFTPEPRQVVNAILGEQIMLHAYHLIDMRPGRQAQVVIWWRAIRRPDKNYTAFVHLLNAQGKVIAQFDKLPLSDFYPMRAWPLNLDQRDAYPLDVPKGTDLKGAWLAVGLYDHRTGRRLLVSGGGDFVRIPVAAP